MTVDDILTAHDSVPMKKEHLETARRMDGSNGIPIDRSRG